VAIEPAGVPAHIGIEAGRVTDVDLPGAAALVGETVARHQAPLPGVAPVSGAPLRVSVVAGDVRIVVTARVIRVFFFVLADAAPHTQARPPVRAVVRFDLGEELVPAAGILAGATV